MMMRSDENQRSLFHLKHRFHCHDYTRIHSRSQATSAADHKDVTGQGNEHREDNHSNDVTVEVRVTVDGWVVNSFTANIDVSLFEGGFDQTLDWSQTVRINSIPHAGLESGDNTAVKEWWVVIPSTVKITFKLTCTRFPLSLLVWTLVYIVSDDDCE